MDFTTLIYNSVLGFINFIKWGELQLLRFFSDFVVRKGIEKTESIGIHIEEDGEELTKSDEKRILANCNYDRVIRVKVQSKKDYFLIVANLGNLGVGDSYSKGIWDVDSVEDISEMARRRLQRVLSRSNNSSPWRDFQNAVQFSFFNLQTKSRAFQVAKQHYDIGNEMYEVMLDPWMQYSCGYWANAGNLNDAQIDKMELIAKKLDLKPGMRILDIGCGWGMLCKYLAEKYKVECVGLTVSEEQVAFGRNLCNNVAVEIKLQDYRDVDEEFDRIVSVGMFEHVGFHNYSEFFKVARRCLKDDGLFLLHTIGLNHKNIYRADGIFDKIFPNGMLPYAKDITNYSEGYFVIEDWHNFSLDYSKTLNSWRENFINNWTKIEHHYDKRFYRFWIFYLSLSKALFDTRATQLWQIVLSKNGLRKEYRAAR